MTYKESFIKFMADSGVLKFGEFTLKSGRVAPYFINCGNYKTGKQLAKLGEYYAECIHEHNLQPEILFGPAYKGIPLSVAACTGLYNKFGYDCSYCFDRKEVKDHGEGGMFVGQELKDGDKVVIIDDVMTSGKALREGLPKLTSAAKIDVVGMVITMDRAEKGLNTTKSAVQDVHDEFGINVYSIVNINDVIDALENGIIPGAEYVDKMKEYRKTYGVD